MKTISNCGCKPPSCKVVKPTSLTLRGSVVVDESGLVTGDVVDILQSSTYPVAASKSLRKHKLINASKRRCLNSMIYTHLDCNYYEPTRLRNYPARKNTSTACGEVRRTIGTAVRTVARTGVLAHSPISDF